MNIEKLSDIQLPQQEIDKLFVIEEVTVSGVNKLAFSFLCIQCKTKL